MSKIIDKVYDGERLSKQELGYLLKKTQDDDTTVQEEARALVLSYVHTHIGRYVNKYRKAVVAIGLDMFDIEQAFLLGVFEGLGVVDLSIGDPFRYLLQRGDWKARDEIRKAYKQVLRVYCHECKSEVQYYQIWGVVTCPKCGARGEHVVETFQHTIPDDGTLIGFYDKGEELTLEERYVSEAFVAEFAATLRGRQRDVWDMVMNRGIDRSSATNYIKEIAAALGITPANVNIRLRQIRQKWLEYSTRYDTVGA